MCKAPRSSKLPPLRCLPVRPSRPLGPSHSKTVPLGGSRSSRLLSRETFSGLALGRWAPSRTWLSDAADLLAGCSVSASSPGAERGDGPGPDLQRLHWPTAARRVPANNCTKMRQRRTLRAGQALALGTFPLAFFQSLQPELLGRSCTSETHLSWKANYQVMKLAFLQV